MKSCVTADQRPFPPLPDTRSTFCCGFKVLNRSRAVSSWAVPPQPGTSTQSRLRGRDVPGCVGQADQQQGREAGVELQLPQRGQVHVQRAGPELLLQVRAQSAGRIPVNSRKHQRGRGQVQGILGARERQKDELARD